MNKDLVLMVGNGGHARVLRELMGLQLGDVEIVIADKPGSEVDVLRREKRIQSAVIGIGDNYKRKRIAMGLLEIKPDLKFPALIHPSAIISKTANLGSGTMVMAGALINPGAHIGSHCVVNTGAVIEHDCHISDYSTIATKAAVGGRCIVGEGTLIGSGATVLHHLKIGANTVVGAGAVVLQDVPDRVVTYGVPAKVARECQEGESFLP